MKKKFYITTTLPYVNASPHIGFAAEIIRADVLARYHRLKGYDVFFNTGTDEHGLKILRKAEEEGMDPKEYTDQYATQFDNLKKALNLSYNNFIRTTDENHIKQAQEFWKLCKKNGDIYKKNYKVKYCVGCELELTESELVDGKCPLHPNAEIELIEEENYFFRWSAYGDKLLKFYNENPDFVIPDHKFNEIKRFIERGLEDFSISRLKEKMPWGVPVPDDENHVMYVWFDALTNYINSLDWIDNKEKLNDYWGTKEERNAIQVAGKDNLRQQSAMWQAMLMSAGFPLSKQILIFGFINSDGQKMSKSLGNVISPYDLVEKYKTDATRYYLLAELQPFEDSDFTYEKFETRYNADLANGIGNLVARSITMALKIKEAGIEFPDCLMRPDDDLDNWGGKQQEKEVVKFWEKYEDFLDHYHFDKAIGTVIEHVSSLDNYISQNKPWEMIKKKDDKSAIIMYNVIERIRHIAIALNPFLPETSEKIFATLGLSMEEELSKDFKENKKFGLLDNKLKVKKGDVLFPRLT